MMSKTTIHLRFTCLALPALLLAPAVWVARAGEPAPQPTPKLEGKAAAVEATRKAFAWLIQQANEDGTFGQSRARAMPGVVGLTLYALATSPGKPNPEQVPALAKAAAYLVSQQMPEGAIAIKELGNFNYNTSVAVMALKALNDPKYGEVLEKAKAYILGTQLDQSKGYDPGEHERSFGAFSYGSSKKADLSNTAFSLDALKALGVKEDSPAFKNAMIFIRRCQDNPETNDAKEMKNGDGTGGFVYAPGDSEFGKTKSRSGLEVPTPYGNMTYAGVKALIYCGIKPESPELSAAWRWIKNNYTVKSNPGGRGTQGYFYYVVSFAKAFTASGTKELTLPSGQKVDWAKDLSAHLTTLQKPDGSFTNDDERWMENDPILATAYALHALNLCVEAMK